MIHPPTVLLVEDDDVDAIAVRRAFRSREPNVTIVRAANGEAGLTALRGLRADGNASVVVLLDLNMPRMNGAEFLAAMRSDASISSTVAFVLTTSCDERDIRSAYEHNVAGYLEKTPSNEAMKDITSFMGDYFRRVTFPVQRGSLPKYPSLDSGPLPESA